jgi:hypothetical protein
VIYVFNENLVLDDEGALRVSGNNLYFCPIPFNAISWSFLQKAWEKGSPQHLTMKQKAHLQSPAICCILKSKST